MDACANLSLALLRIVVPSYTVSSCKSAFSTGLETKALSTTLNRRANLVPKEDRAVSAIRIYSRCCTEMDEPVMKIKLNSVLVDDQDKALDFYTRVLGFVKKNDIPVGRYRWLTVVSPEEPEGTELVLEPSDNPAAQVFKKALFEQGIPWTAFAVDDIQNEYERMTKLGVVFKFEPVKVGEATIAVFEDTCGNLIQIYQVMP